MMLLAAILWTALPLGAETVTAIDTGSANQILFDDFFVAEARGFRLVGVEGLRDGPVLQPEEPWEKKGIWAWLSVIYENGMIRLWYDAVGEDGVWRLCYAASTDGLHFVRPRLGLYEYGGSRANNICFVAPKGYHAGTVFRDDNPAVPPQERYKLVYGGGGRIGDTPYLHIAAAASPDGLHWRHVADAITPWYTDTMNVCFWDPARGEYMLYVRYWTGKLEYRDGRLVGREDYGKRGVGFCSSRNWLDFPRPRLVLAPDEADPDDVDLYNSAARKYPLAQRAYMMFISAFCHSSDCLDVQLATSRDGEHWQRLVREPVVRLGPAGSFDSDQIYVGAGQALVGDEVWMYYGGWSSGHNATRPGQATARIGRVRWLRDRFAGWRAGHQGGQLVTKPIAFRGRRLTVNYDAGASGVLRVAVERADGQQIAGFGLADCQPLRRNQLDGQVKWAAGADALTSLAGVPVRLRFQGRDVTVYSFRFSD